VGLVPDQLFEVGVMEEEKNSIDHIAQSLAIAEERAKEERRQQWLQEKAAMERAGMTWCVEAACFVDSAGRIVPE